MRLLRLCVHIASALSSTACSNLKSAERPLMCYGSLDAFRWDYDSIYSTPVLDDIAAPVMGREVYPSFPTKTFPNTIQ